MFSRSRETWVPRSHVLTAGDLCCILYGASDSRADTSTRLCTVSLLQKEQATMQRYTLISEGRWSLDVFRKNILPNLLILVPDSDLCCRKNKTYSCRRYLKQDEFCDTTGTHIWRKAGSVAARIKRQNGWHWYMNHDDLSVAGRTSNGTAWTDIWSTTVSLLQEEQVTV